MPGEASPDGDAGASTSGGSAMPKLPPRKSRVKAPAGPDSKCAEPSQEPRTQPQDKPTPQPTESPFDPLQKARRQPSTVAVRPREAVKEDPAVARLRQGVQQLRVLMFRAALRLGWQEHFVHQVMYRLQLAENLQLPKQRPPAASPPLQDPMKAAEAEAHRLEALHGPEEALGMKMTILLIGFRGSGKTSLVNTLLGRPPTAEAHPPTRKVHLQRGLVAGIEVVCIDTPGLDTSPAATWSNMAALRRIRAAHRRHRPDSILFVEQLQEGGDVEDEAAVLQLLTTFLGPEVWCNTVVAFTHAADAARGQASWQAATKQREQPLQHLIRHVSADPRLVNPVVWVENRWDQAPQPGSPQGQASTSSPTPSAEEPVIFEGHPFRLHLRLMLLSAKILSDTEALFGRQTSGQASPAEAAPLPLGYLLTQVLSPTEPLRFPNSQIVTQLRRAREAVRSAPDPWRRKRCAREEADMRRQLATQHRYSSVITPSSVDRVLRPPGSSKHSPVDPPMRHRYVAVLGSDSKGVICSGTVVRPQLDPAAALDHGDSVVGATVEHTRVLLPGAYAVEGVPTEGFPAALSFRGQCNKDHALVQARAEACCYHDLLDRHVGALTLDLQTSGALSDLRALCTLQADHHIQDPSGSWSIAGGVVGSELAAPSGLVGRPSAAAVGVRQQLRLRGQLLRLVPAALSLTAGQLLAWLPTGEVEPGLGASSELNFNIRSQQQEQSGGGVSCSSSTSVVRVQGAWTRSLQASAHWKAAGAKWGVTTHASGGQGRVRLRAHAHSQPLLVALGAWPLLYSTLRRLQALLATARRSRAGHR